MHYYENIEDDLRYKFEINKGWKHIGQVYTKNNGEIKWEAGTISICAIEYK
jgi:hypothetical protein